MNLDRTALLALLLLGCSSEPGTEITPDPSSTSQGSGTTGPLPPDMDMPLADNSTTAASSSTGAGTTGVGGGTATGGAAGTSGSMATTSGVGGMTLTTTGGVSDTGTTTGTSTGGAGGVAQGGSGGSGTVGTTTQGGSSNIPPDGRCAVEPLTQEFRQSYDNLDPFYQKIADANGLPVISSASPADEALTRACELVIDMVSARPDVLEALIDNHIRFAIIGEDELTNDIPEYRYLDDSINTRARGLGGTPAASCAEESILCNTDLDRWRGEGICVHEFAHTIASGGLFPADPTFQGRLQDAYESARDAGLFANTYAMENYQEYWAEGVQDWYYTNLEADPPNGIHNFVDRREELQEYDPTLHDLIAEFLPDEPGFVDCYSDE